MASGEERRPDETEDRRAESDDDNGDNKKSSGSGYTSVGDLFLNLTSRDDVINSDQMEPDKLKDIQVSASRGDTLNAAELRDFELIMKKYAKLVIGAEPDETHFAAFVLSMVQAALNQSTSVKNERQHHLINTFTVGGKEYEWKTAHFLSTLRGSFQNIQNPLRRYLRTIEGQVAIMKSTGKVVSDGHLAAKHGTTSQFWNCTSDFTNGCGINISDDDLSANYLQKQIATKNSKKTKTIYNVSQLASNVE